jgi:hypothetical protein
MQPKSTKSSNLRNWLLGGVAIISVVYTIVDWSALHEVREKLSSIAFLPLAVAITEICFITGAVLMLIALGEEFAFANVKNVIKSSIHAKRNIKEIASKGIRTATFGIGFWLNFLGAVGTSLILLFGVFYVLPIQAWGVSLIILIDLIATFAWRVPLQMIRTKKVI